jgi:hypothetical protein
MRPTPRFMNMWNGTSAINNIRPRSKLRRLSDSANPQLGAILLQNRLAVVLPERLGSVLASEALEDLGAAGVFVEEAFVLSVYHPLMRARWMRTGDVVDAVVNNDVHARFLVLVGSHVGLGESLGHDD